jgi:hypothetical protein
VSYGKARCSSFTPEITFRAQPHATFKFLFNGSTTEREGGDAAK